MNREIKFRFWLGHIGKMSYSHDLKEVGKIIPDFTDDIIPLEYTGLKDKNGTEIYEGDVIQTKRQDWGVIIWNAPFFEVTVSETQSSMYSREWFDTVEVIGNIYENPELLKS